ncbi:MAG: hypothetical protein HKN68_06745 [Saprospiraceae bacterium]|nr:hypothetical protein [Saprospiraceae bacterium]
MISVIASLLLIPLVAMQFTDEVKWDFSDFVIMGLVLTFIAGAYELIVRKSQKTNYKIAFGVGLLGAFLLFWVNGAVGIIGNEGQSANLLFGAVFLVGFIGALISRFKAKGMAKTLFVVAAVQMLVPVSALIIWPPPDTSWSPGIFGVFWMCAFFAMLFMVSGFLFNRAAENN